MKKTNPNYKRGTPELQLSYSLYIDILGFSNENMSKKTIAEENRSFQRFYNVYKSAIKDLKFDTEFDKKFHPKNMPFSWAIKLFSDNILIGCPILKSLRQNEEESLFGQIIIELIFFQMGLAINGYFLRGAWSINSLYIDEDVVFGNGLIETYNLQKEAVYPCIVLSDWVKTLVLDKHMKFYAHKTSAPQYDELLKDERGEIFINYLISVIFDDNSLPCYKDLLIHKTIVSKRLRKYSKNKKIHEKYRWLADYHNYFCDTFLDNCPKKYYVKQRKKFTFRRIK